MRRATFLLFLIVTVAAGGAACTLSLTGPTNNAPYTVTDIRIGTGAVAATNNTLAVNYAGWLYDDSQPDKKGVQFDASAADTPFSFTLGAGQVIEGWDKGVAGMKVGGIRRLVIPPSMAYGDKRHGIIPPNATLVFDIELVSLQ